MASATTRPTFSFFHPHHQSTKPPSNPLHLPLIHKPPPTTSLTKKPPHSIIVPRSVDVSQDDKPLPQTDDLQQQQQEAADEEEPRTAFNPRRLEEKFAVINTGVYECRSCGYRYVEAAGDPSYPVPPGLEFGKLPEDWRCPTCGAAKSFFGSKSVEVAGFAENQQFGLGANTLTSGQKALLIYGSLLFFFVLFLSGYFLQ